MVLAGRYTNSILNTKPEQEVRLRRQCFFNWNITSNNRKSAISELLKEFSFKDATEDLLLTALETREQAEATVVHQGIAIPHCRSILVDDFMIAIGRSEKGIPWPDETVSMIILFLTPVKPSGSREHMMLISQIAKSLRGDGANRLLSAGSPIEAASVLNFELRESDANE